MYRWILLAVLALAIGLAFVIVLRDDWPSPPPLSGPRPATLTVETIGVSVEGRRIEALSVGSGPSTVLVIGGLHTGAENPTADLTEQLARYLGLHVGELPGSVRVVFIPQANPDGYADATRVNANGVDLNRNWPTADWQPEAVHGKETVSGGPEPLSEPETSALYAYITDIEPDVVISFHGYGAVVEPNDSGAARDFAAAYSKAAHYKQIENWLYYEITGEFIESMHDLDTAAFDVELGDSEKNRFGKHLSGLKAVLQEVVTRNR